MKKKGSEIPDCPFLSSHFHMTAVEFLTSSKGNVISRLDSLFASLHEADIITYLSRFC